MPANAPQGIIQKYRWTEDDNIIVSTMYIHGKTTDEVKKMLPHLKLSSIKMKYGNCLFLQMGAVRGSLANVSKKHKSVWTVLTAHI